MMEIPGKTARTRVTVRAVKANPVEVTVKMVTTATEKAKAMTKAATTVKMNNLQ
jgi:hypothetical protein